MFQQQNLVKAWIKWAVALALVTMILGAPNLECNFRKTDILNLFLYCTDYNKNFKTLEQDTSKNNNYMYICSKTSQWQILLRPRNFSAIRKYVCVVDQKVVF